MLAVSTLPSTEEPSDTTSSMASPANELPARLAQHLGESRLIRPGARVLVALSGGLDSVTLLHLLRFYDVVENVDLHAAHYDHGMRADSAEDRRWVEGLCRAWELPLHVGMARTPPRGEADARALRYSFLAETADAIDADHIVTAHHANDQAETVWFRLSRGTGVRGLGGIPARRGRIIRPLLPFLRTEIAAYAAASGIQHREDPTNVQLSFARNRIRNVVLPALERVRPGVTRLLAGIAADAARLEERWQRATEDVVRAVLAVRDDDAIELARDALRTYDRAVRARVVRTAFHRLGSTLSRSGTRTALEFITSGAAGGAIELAGGVRLERTFDKFVLRRADAPVSVADHPLVIHEPGTGSGMAVIGGTGFVVDWSTSERDTHGDTAVFDPTALRFPLELRGWRPGDRIRFDYGSKKLKKLFAERRVAREARSRVPVLVESSGAGHCVIWIVGHAQVTVGRSQNGPRFRITVRHA